MSTYDVEISGSRTAKATAKNTRELLAIAQHSKGGLVSVVRGDHEVFFGHFSDLATACELALEYGREL